MPYLWVRVVQDGVAGVVAAHLDAELHQPQRHRVVYLLRVARHSLYRRVQHGRVSDAADLSNIGIFLVRLGRDYILQSNTLDGSPDNDSILLRNGSGFGQYHRIVPI